MSSAEPVVADPPGTQTLLQLRLNLFGRVGLVSGVLAVGVMLLIAWRLMPERVGDYRSSILAFQLSAENLPWVLGLAGAALAACAGLIAWALSLYSSFRVAGPVYRFSRNLEILRNSGPTALQPIRQGDCLQEESRALQVAAFALRDHYRDLDACLARLEAALPETDPVTPDQLEAMLREIAEVCDRVRL